MRQRRRASGLTAMLLVAALAAVTVSGCVVEPEGVAYVHMAPPAPEVEVIGVAPGAGYVWIAGHHAWRGEAYGWVPGRWELPPREHARWSTGSWHHNRNGWYWVEGRWR